MRLADVLISALGRALQTSCAPTLGPRYAVHRTADQQVRYAGQDERRHQRFTGIKPAKFNQLINRVENYREHEDFSHRLPSAAKPLATVLRVRKQPPEIWRPIFAS